MLSDNEYMGAYAPFFFKNSKEGAKKMNTELLLFMIIGLQIAQLFVSIRGAANGN